MLYRRQPQISRKYIHNTEPEYTPELNYNQEMNPETGRTAAEALIKAGGVNPAAEIPLPNEIEASEVSLHNSRNRTGKTSFLSNLKDRIHLEEIILLGLIFLLLDEKVEDDFLLLLLVYILIF